VLEVLDGHMERVPHLVEVGHDRVVPPVAVTIDDVAAVARGEQLRVEPLIRRPRLRTWAHSDFAHGA
jgi:hypothetical protein